MLFWIIKIIIFSIIFIFLIHNILNFLLETLTIYKTKDMIQISNENYKNIYDILSQNIDNKNIDNKNINQNNIKRNDDVSCTDFLSITPIDSLPNIMSEDNMKNELINYLREQLK
jgi:hypothetical protein